ncbi:hypothetical protein NPX13_g10901 [Xylaria arbuscula]|uniref:Uncharacterized protein n=1 Tax=Xylaria arbuscula TaxID=114810 RepID=A0A9W8N3V0_9PEZI|nr:hypothetical protein NPX13_g10901 [Xylaria arbuscula]
MAFTSLHITSLYATTDQYIQLDAAEKPHDEFRENKMRGTEEGTDAFSRLRGEEKSSRRHSRGKKDPISLCYQNTLGVEADDTGGDEPELAPEDVSWGKQDHETLDTAEDNMTTEDHPPEEVPMDKALLDTRSLKEFAGDSAIQNSKDISATQSGRSDRNEKGPSGEELPQCEALALSPADGNDEIDDIAQHPNVEGNNLDVEHFSEPCKKTTEETVHLTQDSALTNNLAPGYEPADIDLPPSPLLSQVEVDLEPGMRESGAMTSALLSSSTVEFGHLGRNPFPQTHELYHIQAPITREATEYDSGNIYRNSPAVFTGADHAALMAASFNMPTETSPWETVDEDETSEQVWETTDDETIERSVGDFRLPRDTLSDIAEVIQEPSENISKIPRDFALSTAHLPNQSNPNLHYAENPSPKVSQLDLAHCAQPSDHSDRDGSEHQFQVQDWANWCESEVAAGSLPENPEFHPHYLDTISENSDDEFVVRKLAIKTSDDDLGRLHSAVPNETSEALFNESPLEGVSNEPATDHYSKSVGSLDEVQDTSFAWPLVPAENFHRNEIGEWPDIFRDEEDESEVETQQLQHVFDHTRFVSGTSVTSHFHETEQHPFNEKSMEEMAAIARARDHDNIHFDQRPRVVQVEGEESQQGPQRGFTWLSTRSSSIDQSPDMNFEPLLDDRRLETIGAAFAPNEALATGEGAEYVSENASISDLELRAASPNEARRIGRDINPHSVYYTETSLDSDQGHPGYQKESMLSSDLGLPKRMGLRADPLEHPKSAGDRPILPDSQENKQRPILVHSSTQTDEEFVLGAFSPPDEIHAEEPRSPTPAIVLPDLGDFNVKSLARAKSLKKKHRQHFRELEETVATAVVIYATAQKLSPPPSPPYYGLINNNMTERLDATQGLAQASSDVVSSEISAQHSVDESDFSSSVADLSTDDERHRHRSHRSHHHSSRPKETVNGDEHRSHRHRHHKSRDENEQPVKTSSDRSIFSRHRKEEPVRPSKEESRRHDGSHESSSHRRHRTPEEQAAHDRRKEERRAQRELERERERQLELSREQKGKEAETTPPSSERHSPRSSRRSGQSDLRPGHSHSERRVSIKEESSPVASKKFFNFRGGESILDAARVSPEDEIEASNRASMRSHSRSHRDSGDPSRAAPGAPTTQGAQRISRA